MLRRIIVTRFSAMGDVAMVASVLRELLQQFDTIEIIMVSRSAYQDFFENNPRLKYHVIDPKGKHKGFFGLYRLFKELKMYKADAVADLHNNLRSRILGFFFKLRNIPVVMLDKGRKEKKQLTRKHNKILKQLKPTVERYADVFRTLGFGLNLKNDLVNIKKDIPNDLMNVFALKTKKIGIAPFAQHIYKVFSFEKMKNVIADLVQSDVTVFIFGGGEEEYKIAKIWQDQFSNKVYNLVGKYNISEELTIISNLDLMLSMDSSGMHMASLMGVRCVSIWGTTHPFAGFLGYGQSYQDCIQVAHPSRPSSIYGNKPRDCDGVEAIDLVTEEMVTEHIKMLL